MKKLIHVLLVLVLMLGSLFIVGCGNDDDDNGGSGTLVFDPTSDANPGFDYLVYVTTESVLVMDPEGSDISGANVKIYVDGEEIEAIYIAEFGANAWIAPVVFQEGEEKTFKVRVSGSEYESNLKCPYSITPDWPAIIPGVDLHLEWELPEDNQVQYINAETTNFATSNEDERIEKLNGDVRSYTITSDWLDYNVEGSLLTVYLEQYNYNVIGKTVFLSTNSYDPSDIDDSSRKLENIKMFVKNLSK